MAGGTDSHDCITVNILTLINLHYLRDSACRVHSGNVKVNYRDGLSYYPDAFVTCDLRDLNTRYIKQYPKLIVEVLSSSTQAFDRGDKSKDYQQIESLEEYVLISQQSQQVECRRRTSGDQRETTIYGAGDLVSLKSIELDFKVSELYLDVDR